MLGNVDTFRAILFAALMVFSVFAGTIAFAGSAAGADDVAFSHVDATQNSYEKPSDGINDLDPNDLVVLNDGDTWYPNTQSGQTITGVTTAVPGTSVTLQARGTDPANPFILVRTAEVESDGTFSADFDLSDVPNGTELTVEVQDRSDSEISAIVLDPDVEPPTPDSTPDPQECTIEGATGVELAIAYNQNLDEIPGLVRGRVSDQRVDLRIDTPDGERQFLVATESDGRIANFREGSASEPTLRVETSESALCSIATSDDHVAAFGEAYSSGEIDISGVGIGNTVVVESAKFATRVISWFS